MEDRHYLSDPRPIKGLDLLTWDVDIMREGVDQPIMTLRLDSQNLPPRTRKKKVVWQLPDSWDQVPKFGKEDKLRILELFKQHKKTTKKEKRKSQPSGDSENGGSQNGGSLPETEDPDELTEEKSSVIPTTPNEVPSTTPSPPAGLSNEMRPQPKGGGLVGPPGFEALSLEEKKEGSPSSIMIQGKGLAAFSSSNTSPTPLQPPPGIPSLVGDFPPPITPPPGIPTTPLARYFHIPSPLPNNPTTMSISDIVTQSYYTMLTHGHVQDLKRYFTPTATKSMTVGGAHAICASEEDKDRQLQSLVGIVVAIRGVLQQSIPMATTIAPPPSPNIVPLSTPPGLGSGPLDSVLIVITGVCVRPHTLPFCHTLVLVARPEGYQIQNDALCFLTADSPVVTP